MSLLPIFIKAADRAVLVVGAGAVALDKIETLLTAGASVRVVAPTARLEVREYAQAGKLAWREGLFEDTDLDGVNLVIAATDSQQVNESVHRAAAARGVLCNSVDDIPNCDFYFGSIVQRGDLQIAISTNGESPALAQRLRREIEAQLPEDVGSWLGRLGELRRQVLEMHPRSEGRKLLLHQLAQRPICDSPTCPSRLMAIAGFPQPDARAGKVYLVGAGPGDPELLTVRAMRLIQTADVVLHDDLVPSPVLSLVSSKALVRNVGKRCGDKHVTQEEINALMIEHAMARRLVVRLKSGDPLIFGRAAEEMEALSKEGIEYEIVPGVTAAFAAAAAAGCALTDRSVASSLTILTGHRADASHGVHRKQLEDGTLVVYMPGRDLTQLAERWLQEGFAPELPCAVISHAAQPKQKIAYTNLKDLPNAQADAPSIVLAGWAIRKHEAATSGLQKISRSA
jgi:uroporphyrin-III C-methyltransferase/precorrin-2 dehydrogenase/sirohydrochlorin ferrochelatase